MSRYTEFPYGDKPSQLVGRVLHGATIGGSRDDVLTITTDGGDVRWDVEGDCCSDSRFTDLKLDALLGKRIAAVGEIESCVDPALDPATLRKFANDVNPLPAGVEEAPQESEQIYGVKITAEDGSVGFVVHRNWSNGYYGGSLSERAPDETAGV